MTKESEFHHSKSNKTYCPSRDHDRHRVPPSRPSIGYRMPFAGDGVKWPGREAAEDKNSASQYMSTSLSSIHHRYMTCLRNSTANSLHNSSSAISSL